MKIEYLFCIFAIPYCSYAISVIFEIDYYLKQLMKKYLTLTLLCLVGLSSFAQMVNPVHFSSRMKMLENNQAEIVFSATIDAGWHVYSSDLAGGGPISASFNAEKMEGAETVGKLRAIGKEIKQFDKLFDMEVRYFEHNVTFVQKIRFTKPAYDIAGYLEYGACNDETCLPPTEVPFAEKGKCPLAEPKDNDKVQTSDTTRADVVDHDSLAVSVPASVSSDLWEPVVDELKTMGDSDTITDHTLLYILFMGFIGGLLAVCMPCIWPIIPMTVSFFLKRSKNKDGVRDAFVYGLSIIVIYLSLGLLVTAFFGSDTLNAMSTNAVFNIFLFLLLVAFAFSFFGWFEIKLPDSWATAVDAKAEELTTHHSPLTSYLSIFLMAFTLVLVSFSCTAPIIGLLLVETATSGNWLAPATGMFGFALALALPFTLFALFPAWLKQTPKSGSWMNTLKIVLGFVELAFALKFFSVADLAYGWHLLDREVFLSLWIVIFALLGAYLCGWLKFQSDELGGDANKPKSVLCIMGGLVSFAFAVYMIPGLWGAPCKAVSAFAPPMSTQDFNLNHQVLEAKYTDYDEGMAAAKAQGKPVLLDFTGFGCVNCRKMEAAVWTDPHVADMLANDFVLISLYVDDKSPLPEPFEVKDAEGNTKVLRTVGAKWSYLQSHKFGANAQPFYVILDNDGKPLTGSRAYDEDISEYIHFLKRGISNYGL